MSEHWLIDWEEAWFCPTTDCGYVCCSVNEGPFCPHLLSHPLITVRGINTRRYLTAVLRLCLRHLGHMDSGIYSFYCKLAMYYLINIVLIFSTFFSWIYILRDWNLLFNKRCTWRNYSLNVNQWTATDSLMEAAISLSLKISEIRLMNQWNRLNSLIESVKFSDGNNTAIFGRTEFFWFSW